MSDGGKFEPQVFRLQNPGLSTQYYDIPNQEIRRVWLEMLVPLCIQVNDCNGALILKLIQVTGDLAARRKLYSGLIY